MMVVVVRTAAPPPLLPSVLPCRGPDVEFLRLMLMEMLSLLCKEHHRVLPRLEVVRGNDVQEEPLHIDLVCLLVHDLAELETVYLP